MPQSLTIYASIVLASRESKQSSTGRIPHYRTQVSYRYLPRCAHTILRQQCLFYLLYTFGRLDRRRACRIPRIRTRKFEMPDLIMVMKNSYHRSPPLIVMDVSPFLFFSSSKKKRKRACPYHPSPSPAASPSPSFSPSSSPSSSSTQTSAYPRPIPAQAS